MKLSRAVLISSADHSANLETQHFSILEALFDPGALGVVRREARSRRASAVVQTIVAPRIGDTGRVGSQLRHGLALAGPALQGLHESNDLVNFASKLLGKLAIPTRASYLYHDIGDHIGLHQDSFSCELTLLVDLYAGRAPLTVHPELVGASASRLVEVAAEADGFPSGGVDLIYPENGAIALIGGVLPHQRRAAREPAMIAALCFKGLW